MAKVIRQFLLRRPSKSTLVLAVVAVGISLLARKTMVPERNKIRVAFALSSLDQSPALLDPANLDNISKYYLLENLAVGLVRDSVSAPGGYEPILASHWKQESPKRWTFHIRPGLRWSDGSPITLEQLAEHFKLLSQVNSRHLVHLRKVTGLEINERETTLTFIFSSDVTDSVLHELSLGDAALVHPENRRLGWSVTSGPYRVVEVSVSPSGPFIRLDRNVHFPGVSRHSPHIVELVETSRTTISQQLKSEEIDIYSLPYPGFSEVNLGVLAASPRILRGQPIRVYLFRFNEDNPLTTNVEVRRWFASLVRNAFAGTSGNGYHFDGQFVPQGYPGRLPRLPDLVPRVPPPPGKTFQVFIHSGVQELEEPWRLLANKVADDGARLELTVGPVPAERDSSWFAELFAFRGNQKEPLGSWNFLFSKELGEARQFHEAVLPLMESIASERASSATLSAAASQLHDLALKEAFIVPVLMESPVVAHSSRVDLSQWNPFDMRLRFQDVRLLK